MRAKNCDPNWVVNHAVTLFGYGRQDALRYWKIMNSWGPYWGERGAIRIERQESEESLCGWDYEPGVGLGCKGGPPKVWVCGSCGILYDPVVPTFAKRPQAESAKLSMQQSDEEDADDEMTDKA